MDKALHAVELHPVQGQGAGRFRAGKFPHNDFGSQVEKALTHAVELHPVQGQGAGRFREGKVPHNEDFRLRKVDTQPRLPCRGGHGGEHGVSLLEASGKEGDVVDIGQVGDVLG